MPSDPDLVDALRLLMPNYRGMTEKFMFGGSAFLVNGNMCTGVWEDQLVIRVSEREAEEHLELDDVRKMDITGRPMKGWLFVGPTQYQGGSKLQEWVERAYKFASNLPPKKK